MKIIDLSHSALFFYVPVKSPARTSAQKMIPVEAVDVVSSVASSANVIASSANDFGGYFYPVTGLISLGAIILYLSPPLAGEE